MTLRRILVASIVLAVAGVLGWQYNVRQHGSSIVVRYAEPAARGTGPLGKWRADRHEAPHPFARQIGL